MEGCGRCDRVRRKFVLFNCWCSYESGWWTVLDCLITTISDNRRWSWGPFFHFMLQIFYRFRSFEKPFSEWPSYDLLANIEIKFQILNLASLEWYLGTAYYSLPREVRIGNLSSRKELPPSFTSEVCKCFISDFVLCQMLKNVNTLIQTLWMTNCGLHQMRNRTTNLSCTDTTRIVKNGLRQANHAFLLQLGESRISGRLIRKKNSY